MIDLEPVVPYIKEYSPFVFSLLGPLPSLAVSILCVVFECPPEKLIDTMMNLEKQNELRNKLEKVVGLPTTQGIVK
jgi:predicted ABC-class ATPase